MLREEPYEPRLSARPADSPALPDALALPDSLTLADSDDERAGIGENFCQPPLLPPPSRAEVEPPELPALDADPTFELPRVSTLLSVLLSALLSVLLSVLWLDRCNPLFEFTFAVLFPGRATSRPLPVDRLFDAAAVAPRLVEKKC